MRQNRKRPTFHTALANLVHLNWNGSQCTHTRSSAANSSSEGAQGKRSWGEQVRFTLNRAWHNRNLVFWLLLRCRSKIKYDPEGHSLYSHLEPIGKGTSLPETSLLLAFSSVCSSLYFETGISWSFATSLLSRAVRMWKYLSHPFQPYATLLTY